MRKPRVVVISRDNHAISDIKNSFERLKYPVIVDSYESLEAYSSHETEHKPSAIFLEEDIEGSYEFLNKTKSSQEYGKKILIPGSDYDPYRLVNYYSEGKIEMHLFRYREINTFGKESLEKRVRQVAKAPNFKLTFDVGLVGYGDFGVGAAHQLKDCDFVDSLKCFSFHHFSQDGYRGVRVIEEKDVEKGIDFVEDLYEIFDDTDIVIVSTGERTNDFQRHIDRGRSDKEIIKEMFEGNLKKMITTLDAAKRSDYRGLLGIITNPTGKFMRIAADKYGFDPRKIFSTPNDTTRARIKLKEALKEKYFDKYDDLNLSSIYVPVVGPHSHPNILFDRVKIKGIPLYMVLPEFSREEAKRKFMEEYRILPSQIMSESRKLDHPYVGTPLQLKNVLERVAHFKKIDTAVEIYVDTFGLNTFIDWSPSIDYSGDVPRFFPNKRFKPLLSEDIVEELKKVAMDRETFIKNLPPNTL